MTGEDLTDRGKLQSLQAVRALAFIGIFLFHCQVVIGLGQWGVSIFFILSGFVMFYTYYDRDLDISIKNCVKFSVNKIRKLYLLHILMMLTALVFLIKALIEDFTIKHMVFCVGDVILNVILCQSWIPSCSVSFSLNSVAWYLSTCLFLYATFPVILKWIKKMKVKTTLMVALAVYAVQIIVGAMTQFINIRVGDVDDFSKWLLIFSHYLGLEIL